MIEAGEAHEEGGTYLSIVETTVGRHAARAAVLHGMQGPDADGPLRGG